VWGTDPRHEVIAYVDAVRTVIANLTLLRPSEQRNAVLGQERQEPAPIPAPGDGLVLPSEPRNLWGSRSHATVAATLAASGDLLELAHATAADGRQRGVGASTPSDLETLRDTARGLIGALPSDDTTRFVLPWLWKADRTTGSALTPEGDEFGYELRFSRYQSMQIKP
jgi:hypothetical protein